MKKMILYLLLALSSAASAQNAFDPAAHSTFQTPRSDGRFVSSRAVVHQLMKKDVPAFAFQPACQKDDFPTWQQQVGESMARLMKYPVQQNLPDPVRLSVQQREGYRLEKWEAYPLSDCAVPYLVLIPDRATVQSPRPAVLCIPGWGGSKEELAGEPELDDSTEKRANTERRLNPARKKVQPTRNAMAWKYVQEGLIAIAVDNPGSGEADDVIA